jgi:hypothetical protein
MFMPRSLPVPTTTEPGRVFATIILSLFTLIGRSVFRDPRHLALVIPLQRYINNTARRFDRLLARLAAGITAKPRPAQPRVRKPHAGPPRVRLPQKRGWIIADLGYHAAGFAGQLNYLLESPENAPLVAASPQAHRLLRPLCHMLGIAPSCIPPLPRRTRKPRPKPAPKPARMTRKQLEALLWYPNIEGRPMQLIPPRKFRT